MRERSQPLWDAIHVAVLLRAILFRLFGDFQVKPSPEELAIDDLKRSFRPLRGIIEAVMKC